MVHLEIAQILNLGVEPRGGMPALEEDIKQAEAEGVILHNSRTVIRILTREGQVEGVACREVRSFAFDPRGRLQVEVVPGTEQILHTDTIVPIFSLKGGLI